MVLVSSFMLCIVYSVNYYLFLVGILQFKEPHHVESYSFARVFIVDADAAAVIVRSVCILIVCSIQKYQKALTLGEFVFSFLELPCFTTRSS